MAADKVDPIHQFHIVKLIPINIGGYDLSFTKSALFMVATVAVASAFLYLSTSRRSLVPGRLQSISEMAYEFVGNMIRDGEHFHAWAIETKIGTFTAFGLYLERFEYASI